MTQHVEEMPSFDLLDPYPWYRYMRDHAPVWYNPATNIWQVFRYDDVLYGLNTPSIFSSKYTGPVAGDESTPFESSVLFIDPPRHKRIRSLTNATFSPKRLTLFEPRITGVVNELLDSVIESGRMDMVTDLAYPLPMFVITEMLGVSLEDREDFQRWTQVFAQANSVLPHVPELDEYFRRVIDERKRHPKDDLISILVEAQFEGEHLEADEILGFCELLLIAGYETTAHLITNCFRVFDERPDVMASVWSNPALIPPMIEETLRYFSPSQFQGRSPLVDTELGGQFLKAGQQMFLMLSSANRDERQFPSPDQFDLYRSPNKHLAFGLGGIHFCLGAPLARMEARIVLSQICKRLSNVQRDRSVQLEAAAFAVIGVKHFPITFQAC